MASCSRMDNSDDDDDTEALRLLALKSIGANQAKFINKSNLISIVPVNVVQPLVNVKLEPISPTLEENIDLSTKFQFDETANDENDKQDESSGSETDEDNDADILHMDDKEEEDSLERLIDQLEAECAENSTVKKTKEKKKKSTKRKKKEGSHEVELVDIKYKKKDAPLISIRESASPEPVQKSSPTIRSTTPTRRPLSPRRSHSPRRSPLRYRSPFRRSRSRYRSRSPPRRSPFRGRSPLRRRSPSPYRRSPYRRSPPRRTSRSRSRSIGRRSPRRLGYLSPKRRSYSPRRWSKSPIRRSRSPIYRRRDTPSKWSPTRRDISPIKRSPGRRDVSPMRSPLRRGGSPCRRRSLSPIKANSPRRLMSRRSPFRKFPRRNSTSPNARGNSADNDFKRSPRRRSPFRGRSRSPFKGQPLKSRSPNKSKSPRSPHRSKSPKRRPDSPFDKKEEKENKDERPNKISSPRNDDNKIRQEKRRSISRERWDRRDRYRRGRRYSPSRNNDRFRRRSHSPRKTEPNTKIDSGTVATTEDKAKSEEKSELNDKTREQNEVPQVYDPVLEARRRKFENKTEVNPISKKISLKLVKGTLTKGVDDNEHKPGESHVSEFEGHVKSSRTVINPNNVFSDKSAVNLNSQKIQQQQEPSSAKTFRKVTVFSKKPQDDTVGKQTQVEMDDTVPSPTKVDDFDELVKDFERELDDMDIFGQMEDVIDSRDENQSDVLSPVENKKRIVVASSMPDDMDDGDNSKDADMEQDEEEEGEINEEEEKGNEDIEEYDEEDDFDINNVPASNAGRVDLRHKISKDTEDKQNDLRTALSRKRLERKMKGHIGHTTLPTRILKSAFQDLGHKKPKHHPRVVSQTPGLIAFPTIEMGLPSAENRRVLLVNREEQIKVLIPDRHKRLKKQKKKESKRKKKKKAVEIYDSDEEEEIEDSELHDFAVHNQQRRFRLKRSDDGQIYPENRLIEYLES